MPNDIHPELKSIGKYLALEGATCFRIPEYQRAYSWGFEQCDALWQDIENFIIDNQIKENKDQAGTENKNNRKNKESYFFGTIIINCQDNDEVLELIDGQQRTTTFLLLLKAFLIHINKAIEKTIPDNESEKFINALKTRRSDIMSILYHKETEEISRMPQKEKDADVWTNSDVLKNCSLKEDFKDELKNILQSWDFDDIEKKVARIPGRKLDYKYTSYFRNFKYFYKKVEDLSVIDINKFAKALLSECQVIEIKSWNVEQAIAMFNSLNSDGLPLTDTDIISSKLFASADKLNVIDQYTDAWKTLQDQTKDSIVDIYALLMQHMYYVRSKNLEIGEAGTNVTTPGLRSYYTFINPDLLKDPIGLCNQLTNLAKIWDLISTRPIIQVLLRFNSNSKLFLASYFYHFNADELSMSDIVTKIEPVAECFLRLFSLLELGDTVFSSGKFKNYLFKESLNLVNPDVQVQTIIDHFNDHISQNWKDKEFDYIKERALEFGSSALVCLNEYLIAKEAGTVNDFRLNGNTQIEHIMPKANKYRSGVMKDVGINDPDEFSRIVDKLGNKILLESSLNQSISDNWFRYKIENGYKKSVYPCAQKLVKTYENVIKPTWGKVEIETATEIAVERILNFIYNK